jgi:hypothetical protein
MSDDPKDGYDVGYGKPPKDHQFKKGQPSPNPKGRPKQEASITAAIRECLEEDVSVTAKDGSKYKILAAKAIGKKVVGQAASGDISSQRLLLSLEKTAADRFRNEQDQAPPDPEEVEIRLRVTHYFANMMNLVSCCGMFQNDADGNTVPSAIGAPLMALHHDLTGSNIRTADEYKEARRDALAQTMEAFDNYALERLSHWQKKVKKSDLE